MSEVLLKEIFLNQIMRFFFFFRKEEIFKQIVFVRRNYNKKKLNIFFFGCDINIDKKRYKSIIESLANRKQFIYYFKNYVILLSCIELQTFRL